MAEGVAGDVFVDTGQACGLSDGLLEGAGVNVMTAGDAAAGVAGDSVGREDILPDPFLVGVGVFDIEGIRKIDCAVAIVQILPVDQPDPLEVFLEGLDEGIGENGDAVLCAFSVADEDDMLVEVEVLHAEADAFHEAEAGAVEEFGHQLVGAGEAGDDAEDLFVGEDGGEALGAFGADGAGGEVEFDAEHFAVEEEDGAEGLVLGGGGDASFDGEVGKEGLDLGGAHLAGVAFVVEEDEASDPGDVGLFGADRVVLAADGVSDLVEEFLGPFLWCCLHCWPAFGS